VEAATARRKRTASFAMDLNPIKVLLGRLGERAVEDVDHTKRTKLMSRGA
jgi:hypothetical protein